MIYDKWCRKNPINEHTNDCYAIYSDYRRLYKFVDRILDQKDVHYNKLKEEWILLNSLNHKGVIKVDAWNAYDTYAYFGMENLTEDFSLILKYCDKTKKDFYNDYITDIVKFLWTQGIIIRDLRPCNFKMRESLPVLCSLHNAVRQYQVGSFEDTLDYNGRIDITTCCQSTLPSYNLCDLRKELLL